MGYWKIRLFALVVIAIGAFMIYNSWQQLMNEGMYSTRWVVMTPIIVVFGVFLLFFPTKIGRPETTLDKFLVLLVFGVGLAAGFYNWYLMDPHYFDDLIKAVSSVL